MGQPDRFRSYVNRLLIACCVVLVVGLVWIILNALLLAAAQLVGISVSIVLIVSAAICGVAASIGIVLACRVSLLFDEATGTVTAVNVFTRSEFRARDVVAVRVVPFPWVRRRGGGVSTCPMIEVKTAGDVSVRLIASAIDTKRGRTGALAFLRATGVRALPTSDEYVDGAYVAHQWTAGTRARSARS